MTLFQAALSLKHTSFYLAGFSWRASYGGHGLYETPG